LNAPSLRYVVVAVAAGMAIYLLMIVLSDADEFASASREFDWLYVVPVIALVTANYLMRAERWHRYLEKIGLRMHRRPSYGIFLAGLAMSVTPGKVGEALKGVLLKLEKNAPIERGVGLVFVERISDVIGVVCLIAIGVIAFPYAVLSISVVAIAVASIIAVVTSDRLAKWLTDGLKRRRKLRRIGEMLALPLSDTRILLKGTRLAEGTAFSVAAWACEATAFFLILRGISADITLLEAVFVYSFSSVVGAISMLPGGMGTTEATMIGLLLVVGVSSPVASFAVILTRVCTLWYAVAVGIVFMTLFRRSHRESEGGGHGVPI